VTPAVNFRKRIEDYTYEECLLSALKGEPIDTVNW
jgi:hypothetical protein